MHRNMHVPYVLHAGHKHVSCMEYTSAMHGICLYHAWNYAWYMHVSDLYQACPVPVKRPNSLHVPVLSHETSMVHALYALQDQSTSMQEIMRDLVYEMC